MKQGDIYEVYLDSTVGSEQSGRRPAVIFSGNLVNKLVNTVIVCPLTSKLKRYKGNLIIEPTKENGLTKTSEAMTIHIRSISKERILKKYGKLTEAEFNQIVESLNKIIKF